MTDRGISADLTAPDPFDHGRTRVEFRQVSNKQRDHLLAVLKSGWNLHQVDGMRAFSRASIYSNNYVIDVADQSLVLRESKILDPARQRVIDDSKKFADDNGLPVPLPLSTTDGATFLSIDGHMVSLCPYVDGEHADGSPEKLEESALLLARFHQVFLGYQESERVRNVIGEVYPRDHNTWKSLERTVSECTDRMDRQIKVWMSRLDQADQKFTSNFQSLPQQVGHFDWHPHNLLFSHTSQKILAILDFDLMRFSERARDVAIAMHKNSRVFGAKTEDKQDINSSIDQRCARFLSAYQSVFPMTDEEISRIPDLLFDEIKRKLIYLLKKHYFQHDCSSDSDIRKQMVQLSELDAISARLNVTHSATKS